MEKNRERSERTCKRLLEHYGTYPCMQTEDVFKYLFQSAFGCEHLLSDYGVALAYISDEYKSVSKSRPPMVERLDGEYSRVHLSCLNGGLSAETLTKLFISSSKKEENGAERVKAMTEVALSLVREGKLPFEPSVFKGKIDRWGDDGYGAVRHSEVFRREYQPAYRVIANKFADFLPIFTRVDELLRRDGAAIIAIEGGSASGKTTLASSLSAIYNCNVIHVDDFFLRPEQRTAERLEETGGNMDRERFAEEVLSSLSRGETVRYRPFNCSVQALGDEVVLEPKRLTVVEGAYSLHPAFGRYFDLAVLLDIGSDYQRERILKRNSPQFATRFFNEWIPMENRYFTETDIRSRVDLVLPVKP